MTPGRPAEGAVRWAVLFIALAVALIPAVSLAVDSFKPSAQFYTSGILPSHWTLQNYQQAFSSGGQALADLMRLFLFAAATTVISVTLGTLAAFGLSKSRFGWATAVTYVILSVRFYPKITTILPYFVMMRAFHLLDTPTALVIAYVSITLPFVVLIMITFFADLPAGLEEAAAIDGCSVWRTFWHVNLPLARPALATAAILTALFSWNEFLIAASVTSQNATTLPVLVAGFITDKGIALGQMSAVSVVIVAPIALFILATQRYLVRGLTLGALKE
jgi:multiple sugar transport system permease protein